MRLLGAPAIPAPGLHPFLGIGTVGRRRAVSISPSALPLRPLERNDLSSNRHSALASCSSMIFFGKPGSTFPDHALLRFPALLRTWWRSPFRGGSEAGAASRRSANVRRQGMSEDIRYNKTFDLVPGRATPLAPGVRAIVANNPSPFTFKGTVSYIVGRGKVAIVDPGPEDDAHITALLDAVRGETVTAIFVTHTHRDHS